MRISIKTNVHAVMTALLMCMVFVYVWQANTQATSSFSVQGLETQKTELTEAVKKLSWDISSARSLSVIAVRADALSFTKPASVSFIEVGLSTVAVADGNSVE